MLGFIIFIQCVSLMATHKIPIMIFFTTSRVNDSTTPSYLSAPQSMIWFVCIHCNARGFMKKCFTFLNIGESCTSHFWGFGSALLLTNMFHRSSRYGLIFINRPRCQWKGKWHILEIIMSWYLFFCVGCIVFVQHITCGRFIYMQCFVSTGDSIPQVYTIISAQSCQGQKVE